MENREKYSVVLIIKAVLFLSVVWLPIQLTAQTANISSTASQLNIQPNETITITLAVDDEVDVFFFGVEVQFDPDNFEFVDEFDTGLMTGGITIADLVAQNRVGASVSLTAPLGSPGSGDLLALTFRAKQAATVGLSDFSFPVAELYDSDGILFDTIEPAVLSIQVDEAVSDLRLTIPAVNQIVEGVELPVSGEVYVNDISVDESVESGRVTVWVGLNLTDTDPSGWSELAWTPMEFDSQQDSYHRYLQNVGFLMSPGTYYIALRAQLDSQPFVYGGESITGGGIWDGVNNANAQLIIDENPPFRYVLAGWNFDDETLLASNAVPANEDQTFQLVGANEDGFSSGATGQSANATSWQFTEGDEKYWLAVLSTEGFQNITISSKQYGTGSSPRDFEIEASLDGLTWELISQDTIRVASSWNSAVIDNLALAAGYEDQPSVYIRWIRRGDTRVDGTEGITTGDNRIDDVFIRGENINPFEVSVWPGDTDNNGAVDELDVLPLGQYWLSAGPLPIFPGMNWAARTVEAWIPEEGTYADANGDGKVDYRDLLPVGLNFGETNITPKQTIQNTEPIAELSLRPLDAGEVIEVAIETELPVNLTGLSFRFRMENIAQSAWKLRESASGEWGTEWIQSDKMLTFERQEPEEGLGSATFVYKGKTDPRSTKQLATFRIEASADWRSEARIVLERLVIAENKSQRTLESAMLLSGDAISGELPGSEIPTELLLRQNYPNPFNPTTVISYSLPVDGQASMILYDMLGREVATLLNGQQKAGTYDLRFDGSNLSSGIYIYRLKAEGKVLTRMLTLIK